MVSGFVPRLLCAQAMGWVCAAGSGRPCPLALLLERMTVWAPSAQPGLWGFSWGSLTHRQAGWIGWTRWTRKGEEGSEELGGG